LGSSLFVGISCRLEVEDGANHIQISGKNAIWIFPQMSLDEDTCNMSRMPPFSSPLLLGFDTMEKTIERLAKSGDSYPPYNIERLGAADDGAPDRLRITLAVAGFCDEDLDVTIEESQLVVRGRQREDTQRDFIHRGIAARQFQRTFVLADGMRVISAELKNGLLSIDLDRPQPERLVRKINISVKD